MIRTRLDLERIRAAREVIDPVFLASPLYGCDTLGSRLGCTVSIKLETANPVRSFKGRGTELVASRLTGQGAAAVVCASAGNLGQALGWSEPCRPATPSLSPSVAVRWPPASATC